MFNKKRRGSGAVIAAAAVLILLSAALVWLIIARSGADEPEAVETAASAPTAAVTAPVSSGGGATPGPADGGDAPALTPSPSPTPVPEPEYFTISMVGDCTLAEAKTRRGWGTALQTVVGSDYAYPFANTRSYFEDDYLTITNLECVLSDNYYDSIEQFVFLAPAAYANILTEGGVDFVTLANNHTMDFGQRAYDDTAAALDAVGVAHAGEDETYIYQTGDGLRVGIYCLYHQLTGNSLGILSTAAQEQKVAESKQLIDAAVGSLREQGAEYIVACLHMGTEGSYETSQVQLDVCRYAVDAGFDLVYCTHAHRLQPAEQYGGGLIFYGMGNWVFGGNTNPGNGTDAAGYDTGIARVNLCRRGDAVTLEGYEFIPCCISSAAGTGLDSFTPTAYTLNNYQPTPYLEGGSAWERTMSILNGAYAGANFVPNYGDVLTQMNG